MRGKDLLECIEQIDDALVEEAMEPVAFPHRGGHWFRGSMAAKWGMAAACVVVLGVSATAFWSHQNIKGEHAERMRNDSAGYPTEMNATAYDSSTGTGNASDGSLTLGAAVEDKKEAADGDGAVHEGVVSGSSDTVRDRAATGGENNITRERAAAESENDTAREETAADGGDHELRKETASDNGEDTSSQSFAADAISDKVSTKVQNIEEVVTESAKLQYTIINDYYGEKDDSVYDYPVPEKGEIICYHYLNETMEHYTELENKTDDTDRPIYAYDVVIDVYGDINMEMEGGQDVHYQQLNLGDIKAGYEKLDQEYIRLVGLGYAVQLAEDFRLTGTFTKVEIDTFQASPEYGYVFRFADEQ